MLRLAVVRSRVSVPASVQSIEEITRIVEEAQKPPQGLADWDNDEYLDGALNQEGYTGGTFDEWGEHPRSGLHLQHSEQVCVKLADGQL